MGVQQISQLCGRLQLNLARQEGSDVFTVGGDFHALQALLADVLQIVKTNSRGVAHGVMFGANSVEGEVLVHQLAMSQC